MTTPTSQDARESALDTLLEAIEGREYHAKHPDHDEMAREMTKRTQDLVSRARAELSALRASPPRVAMEFVEAAFREGWLAAARLCATARQSAIAKELEYVERGGECSDLDLCWRDSAAYDALRPTATGEAVDDLHEAAWGIIAAAWQEAEHITDWTNAAERWRDRYHARLAAIARAEGRKGT